MLAQYTRGKVPGEYIIIKANKKDQLMNNITYTTERDVAPKLPLPVDPAIHRPLLANQVQPVIGTVHGVDELELTLGNHRRGGCSRPHVLLQSPANATASAGSADPGAAAVSWAPAAIDLSSFAADSADWLAPANSGGPSSAAGSLAGSAPQASLQVPAGSGGVRPNTTLLDPLPPGDSVPTQWPRAGGEPIRCPVEIKGSVPNSSNASVLVDVGFARNLFVLQPGAYDQAPPGE